MQKFLGYILTPIFILVFSVLLIIFHPIQWLCLKLGGYKPHKKTVDILNFCLVCTYYLLGNTVKFKNKQNLPLDRPIIFVSNHQSMFDIPPLIYFLRKHHGKFISKIELASGIPSISYNLKYGGGANIKREDSKQSIAEILGLANRMKKNNWSAFIFPEGTRSKTGQMKRFNIGGIATLVKKNPNALIVPIAINNSWKMMRYGYFPLGTFNAMKWEVLPPIEITNREIEEVVAEAENEIRKKVKIS